MKNGERVLFLDIETRPALVQVWNLSEQAIGIDQVIDAGGPVCFAAAWAGDNQMAFHADWRRGHEAMVRAAHDLLDEADAVVTYNGDRFDLPKLRGEFVLAGLRPPAPSVSIDVYKVVRKFGLLSNRLGFVAPLLTGEGKLSHEGHALWTKVARGNPIAQNRLEAYCRQDVRLLRQVYRKVEPYLERRRRAAR